MGLDEVALAQDEVHVLRLLDIDQFRLQSNTFV